MTERTGEERLVDFRLEQLEKKVDNIIRTQTEQSLAMQSIAAKLDKYLTVGKVLWFMAGAVGTLVGFLLEWIFRLFGNK